ncbi:DUF6134 family protein [Parvibaculum sp.]|uniref:DUF6134 family protein n=1 Tax=Parvibaculum sp. TaxID=2024848 RepID=UPI00391974D5
MNSLLKSFAALAIVLSALTVGADAAAPASSPEPALSFRVERGGTPIGTHTINFTQDGGDLHVAIDINLAVSFGPITIFRYAHTNRETWRDGKLVAIETETNDDGRLFSVSARMTDQGLEVTSSENGTFIAPENIIPTSYWNPATVEQTRLLDTQRGRIINVRVNETATREALVDGARVPVREYEMTGDLKLKLWYSPQMEWLNVIFRARGSDVDYHVERFDRERVQRLALQ